jgi:hypothetical protein
VLVFSEHSNDSQLILREVCSAADGRKPIVPYRISRQEPVDSLKYYLGGTHWLDAVDTDSRRAVDKLASECVRRLERPSGAGNKKWILPAVLILVALIAAGAIAAGRGGASETSDEGQKQQTEEPVKGKAAYDNMVCMTSDMTCGEFTSAYEAALEGMGYDPEPFTLELYDETGAPGEADSSIGSIRLSLDQDKAAGTSREEIYAHILAVVSTAFTGDEGDAEALADRLMDTYDGRELAVNRAVDGMQLYSKFTEEGGRMTVEPI